MQTLDSRDRNSENQSINLSMSPAHKITIFAIAHILMVDSNVPIMGAAST
jgi:hypothetical protein